MKNKLCHFGAVRYDNNSILIAGGCVDNKATEQCWLFNTKTSKLKPFQRMFEQRSHFALVKCDGKFYAIGGVDGENNRLNSVEMYDKQNQVWIIVSYIKHKISNHQAVAIDSRILFFCGFRGELNTYSRIVDVYDTKTHQITEPGFKLKVGRMDFAVCYADNYIYIIGGQTFGYVSSKLVEIYSIATNSSCFANDLPYADYHLSACILPVEIAL